MRKAEEYVNERSKTTVYESQPLEDKILRLISQYENPLIDNYEVAKLIAMIIEDLAALESKAYGG